MKAEDRMRELMVMNQIAARGIKDERVLAAMKTVPREEFVPVSARSMAFEDHPVSIGYGQTISQPYMVALMSECMKLEGHEKVLEIGTGSGYQGAILAKLAGEVYTIERIKPLAENAIKLYEKLGIENIHVIVGDGSLGYPEEAPYDAIMVTAAAPRIPQPLLEQLAIGGRLVIPAGSRYIQELLVVTKTDRDNFEKKYICGCVFVPLIGKEGYEE